MRTVQPADHKAPPPRQLGALDADRIWAEVQGYLELADRVRRLVQVDWATKDGYAPSTYNFSEGYGAFRSYRQYQIHGPSHPSAGMLHSVMWLFETAADAAAALDENAASMLEEHNFMRTVDVSSFASPHDALCSSNIDKLRSQSTAVLASRTSSRTPIVFPGYPPSFACCVITQLGGAVIKTFLSHYSRDARITKQAVVRAALESLNRQCCFMLGGAWHPRVAALVAQLVPLAVSVHELCARDGRPAIGPLVHNSPTDLQCDVVRQMMVEKLGAAFTCAACGKVPTHHKEALLCGKCRTTSYCSKACQAGHWKVHKPACHAPAV